MRRGLIVRSEAELPDAALEARLARARAAMTKAQLDALIVYTNNTRSAGVSWLTGFVPYWSEALLMVPRQGAPVLVVALTYRVKTWIERTSRMADVIHTPRIGLEAGRRIAAAKAEAAVGVVELDMLSAGIADDIREAGPRLVVADASELFAQARVPADTAEVSLAASAAAIARHALAQIPHDGSDLGTMLAAAEAAARQHGAEEVYLAVAPDLARDRRLRRIEGEVACGSRFAVRASVAYKGSWVRFTQTFGCSQASSETAMERFAAAVKALPDGRGFDGFASWLVEGCRLTQPLEPLRGPGLAPITLAPHTVVSAQGCIHIDGAPVLVGGAALVGRGTLDHADRTMTPRGVG